MVKREKKPFSLIIIGGGPAGLTAGIYAKRAKIDTILIEKAILGGLITSTELVENYPGFPQGISGMDLGKNFEDQAKKYGLDIIYGKVTKIEVKGKIKEVHTEEHSYSTKAVIIASGSEPQKLGVPGEKALTGKGISYCAICDGPFYKDKNVAVVGGGNAALEEAIFLTRFAKLVTIIHRRDELRADKVLQEKAAANPKIFLKLSTVVEEIVGDKKVRSIKVKDVKTDKTSSMDIDGIFLYVGLKPNTDFLKALVDLDKNGNIVTDDKLATNIEGIFAAGDVRKKHLRQVVTSTADGAIAAHGAKEYLELEGFSLF
ncbi:thioredoxin-disulfide reductase [Candidatus Margulisiibacteriota bacterium]